MSNNDNRSVARRTVLRAAAASSLVGVAATSAAGSSQSSAALEAAGVQEGSIFAEGPTVGLEQVASGLTAPTDFVTAEEETDRRFVVDQTGQVYVLTDDGLEDEPFLDIEERMADIEEAFDERGLLGLAFHPDFEENGRFFVRYSAEGEEPEYGAPGAEVPEEVNHLERLSEFHADDDNETADPDSEEILLEVPQPQFNHNAGPIAFGPDGYLYMATGDGGGGGDDDEGHVDDWYGEIAGGNGQDTEHNLLGGILRLDVDGEDDERNYGIPDDNPLVDEEGQLDEYWSWGHRNPWGMSFENGELLAADVGQALFETINHVEAGGNYGWNVWEGTHCFDPATPEDPPEDCPDTVEGDAGPGRDGEPLLGPVIEYPQEADIGRYADEYGDAGTQGDDRDRIGVAIVGGRMYEGSEVPGLEGSYVFGDWSWNGEGGGRVFIAEPPEDWPNGEDEELVDDEDEEYEDDAEDEEYEDDEYADDEDDYENGDDYEDDEYADEDDDYENGDDEDVDRGEADDADDDGAVDDADDDYENDETDEEAMDDNGDDVDADDEMDDDVVDEESPYYPPDEVDLWSMEEVTFEGNSDVVENGLLTQLVYAFGRDHNGEVYVLTSDTSTVEGEGYVYRLVDADDEMDEPEDDVAEDEYEDEEDDPEAEDEPIDGEDEDYEDDDAMAEDDPDDDNDTNGEDPETAIA